MLDHTRWCCTEIGVPSSVAVGFCQTARTAALGDVVQWRECGFGVVVFVLGGEASQFNSSTVGLVMVGPVCLCVVCCHESVTAWAAFLKVLSSCGVLRVVEGV